MTDAVLIFTFSPVQSFIAGGSRQQIVAQQRR